MHNFSINQRFKKIKYFDSFDYFLINFLRNYMTEKIQKYQIIKFDCFDFLIILMLKNNFYRQTDRPTDIWPYRSDLPSLKNILMIANHSPY